jgi:hypothetical protein
MRDQTRRYDRSLLWTFLHKPVWTLDKSQADQIVTVVHLELMVI